MTTKEPTKVKRWLLIAIGVAALLLLALTLLFFAFATPFGTSSVPLRRVKESFFAQPLSARDTIDNAENDTVEPIFYEDAFDESVDVAKQHGSSKRSSSTSISPVISNGLFSTVTSRSSEASLSMSHAPPNEQFAPTTSLTSSSAIATTKSVGGADQLLLSNEASSQNGFIETAKEPESFAFRFSSNATVSVTTNVMTSVTTTPMSTSSSEVSDTTSLSSFNSTFQPATTIVSSSSTATVLPSVTSAVRSSADHSQSRQVAQLKMSSILPSALPLPVTSTLTLPDNRTDELIVTEPDTVDKPLLSPIAIREFSSTRLPFSSTAESPNGLSTESADPTKPISSMSLTSSPEAVTKPYLSLSSTSAHPSKDHSSISTNPPSTATFGSTTSSTASTFSSASHSSVSFSTSAPSLTAILTPISFTESQAEDHKRETSEKSAAVQEPALMITKATSRHLFASRHSSLPLPTSRYSPLPSPSLSTFPTLRHQQGNISTATQSQAKQFSRLPSAGSVTSALPVATSRKISATLQSPSTRSGRTRLKSTIPSGGNGQLRQQTSTVRPLLYRHRHRTHTHRRTHRLPAPTTMRTVSASTEQGLRNDLMRRHSYAPRIHRGNSPGELLQKTEPLRASSNFEALNIRDDSPPRHRHQHLPISRDSLAASRPPGSFPPSLVPGVRIESSGKSDLLPLASTPLHHPNWTRKSSVRSNWSQHEHREEKHNNPHQVHSQSSHRNPLPLLNVPIRGNQAQQALPSASPSGRSFHQRLPVNHRQLQVIPSSTPLRITPSTAKTVRYRLRSKPKIEVITRSPPLLPLRPTTTGTTNSPVHSTVKILEVSSTTLSPPVQFSKDLKSKETSSLPEEPPEVPVVDPEPDLEPLPIWDNFEIKPVELDLEPVEAAAFDWQRQRVQPATLPPALRIPEDKQHPRSQHPLPTISTVQSVVRESSEPKKIPVAIAPDVLTPTYTKGQLPEHQSHHHHHHHHLTHYDADSPVIVTALIDIGRGKWTKYTRTYEQYLSYLEDLLALRNRMVIFTDRRGADFVHQRRHKANTEIFEITMRQIPLYKYRDEMQQIINDEQREWKFDPATKDHPEANFADYDVVVNSKPYFLYNATQSSRFRANAQYFAWIDAGYGHGEKSVIPTKCHWKPTLLDGRITVIKITPEHDKVTKYSISDLYRVNWSVVSGGFLGGDIGAINRFYRFHFKVFIDLLDQRKVDDDQTLLTVMLKEYASIFNVVHSHGEWNALFRLFPYCS